MGHLVPTDLTEERMIAQLAPRLMLVAVVLALTLASPVFASTSLYSAEVAVNGDTGLDREDGFAEALRLVITKLSGDRGALEHPVVVAALADSERLVRGFGYVDREDTAGQRRRMLAVQFDPQALQQLLQNAGVPVWGSERPDVMAWLAIEQRGQREMVGQDATDWAQSLTKTARTRGLRVFFPLLDLEERQMVPASELWGGYTDGVERVAERYAADTFLIGRVSEMAYGSYNVRWLLHDHGNEQFWRGGPHMSLEEAMRDGAQELADRLAARYAVAAGDMSQAGAQRIVVEGVQSADDYASVLRYLDGLSLVDSVAVMIVDQDTLTLSLSMSGDGQRLIDTVRLGQILELSQDLTRPGTIVFRVLP
jgi:hypothetical protein